MILIGPQLQALYCSEDSAQPMCYHGICTENILKELNLTNGHISSYKDFFSGEDYLEAIQQGHIKEGDPVLMFSINGAQLYQSKASCKDPSQPHAYLVIMFTFVYIIFFTSNNHTYMNVPYYLTIDKGLVHFGSEVRKVSYNLYLGHLQL
jgi:hypothetical protein